MNNQTKNKVSKLSERCGSIVDLIEELKEEIEHIKDSMQERYDNMTERIQEGDKGDELQSEIDKFESIISALEQAGEEAMTAKDDLNEISEN